MSPHPIYFGKSRFLPDVSEDLGKEMGSRGYVCLYVWRKLVTYIFLVSVTLESYSPWVEYRVCFSPAMIAALSGLIASSRRKQSPLLNPQSTLSPKLESRV